MATFTGTTGADTFNGGAENDVVRGNRGADLLNGGDGADRFFWNMFDGSDVIDGGTGNDTQFLTGSTSGEAFLIDVSGSQAVVTAGSDTVKLSRVETINVQPGAGMDNVQIRGGLQATDVRNLVVDLSGSSGSGDQTQVLLFGGVGNDAILVQDLSATGVRTFDTAAGVTITTNLSALNSGDVFTVDGGPGADTLARTTPNGVASAASIVLRGGAGNDTVTGSDVADTLFGDTDDDSITAGAGNDAIDGGTGDDTLLGGAGNDTINDGGGLDFLDGGTGNDVLVGSPGDTVFGGSGNDVISCSGFSEVDAGEDDDLVILHGVNGSVGGFVKGGIGADTVRLDTTQILVSGWSLNTQSTGAGSFNLTGQTSNPIRNSSVDLLGVEFVEIVASRFSDTIHIGDMRGTGVIRMDVDLGSVGLGSDGVTDVLRLDATSVSNQITGVLSADGIVMQGLSTTVTVRNAGASDTLDIRGLTGSNDVFDFSALIGAHPNVVLRSGGGVDILSGAADGRTTFVLDALKGGDVVITNFHAHKFGPGDVLNLSGFDSEERSLAALFEVGHIFQSGADVIVTDVNHIIITLQNVLLTDLVQSDFLFT